MSTIATTTPVSRRKRLLADLAPWQRVVIDGAVAVCCLALAALDLVRRDAQGPTGAAPVLLLLDVLATVPLVARRVHPTAVLLVVASACAATTALGRTPLALDAALGFAVFAVAAGRSRRSAILVLLVTEALLGAGVVVAIAAHTAGDYVIHSMLAAGALWFAGDGSRSYRELERTTVERNRLLDAERADRARRATQEERIAIAREVHDVVAHSLTVMTVQAGVGARTGDPTAARTTLTAIETAGRTAQTELRAVLTLLREDDDSAPLAPAPSLADLGLLVQQVRDAGTPVVLEAHRAGPLPGAIEVMLFRIVQEALTNVVKHAPGAATTVSIAEEHAAVVLRVENGPLPDRSAGGWRAAGPGHGLAGMRERVAAFGGGLSAGPTATSGYLVEARIPLLAGAA